MVALTLTQWVAGAGDVMVLLVIVAALAVFVDWRSPSPYGREVRARRRHAKRTARAMRRMTEIRRQTAERMDRTEGRRQ